MKTGVLTPRGAKTVMRLVQKALWVVAILAVAAWGASAYTSDRMDFGEIDFKGATVSVVAHFDNLQAFYEGGARAGRLEEAKRLFNIGEIKLVQFDWGSMGEAALNRYLSGDSTYDLWRLPHNGFFTLATRGAFFPVSTILPPEYFEKLPRITQMKNERLRYNGELLHFSAGVPDDFGHVPFMLVNLDLFETENLPDPYELYEAGEWDWETVEEIGRQVTRDTDGDGVVDQWGLAFIDPYMMIFANGGSITRLDDDGRVVYSLGEPAAIEALRVLNNWQNVLGITYGDWQMREWITGKTAMAFIPFWQINPDEYDFRHAVLPLPKGPNTDDHVFAPGVADAIYIPANSAYPLGMVALDNFLFPLEEYEEVLDEMISDRARDRNAYRIMYDVIENVDGDAAYYHNFLGSWWEGDTPYGGVVQGVMGGGAPATVVAEFAPRAQAAIDETLKQ